MMSRVLRYMCLFIVAVATINCSAESDCSAFQSPFSAAKNFADRMSAEYGMLAHPTEFISIKLRLRYSSMRYQPHTIARLPKTAILFRELQLKYASKKAPLYAELLKIFIFFLPRRDSYNQTAL